MVLLKELFEVAKKNQSFSPSYRRENRVKEVETGFLNTRKIRCQACTQGFIYRYKWFDEEEEKFKVVTSVDLQKLRDKVKKKNLDWEVDSYYKARITAKEVGLPLLDLK